MQLEGMEQKIEGLEMHATTFNDDQTARLKQEHAMELGRLTSRNKQLELEIRAKDYGLILRNELILRMEQENREFASAPFNESHQSVSLGFPSELNSIEETASESE